VSQVAVEGEMRTFDVNGADGAVVVWMEHHDLGMV
jgi:hypothetical protein